MAILEKREQWLKTFEEGWLAYYKANGHLEWDLYNHPRNEGEISGPGVDLSTSRLLFISTAGSYVRDEQEPFDAANIMGDFTIRAYPVATPFEQIAIAHDHYDHQYIEADPQVLLPLRHLEDMVAEGVIGSLADVMISYTGYQPNMTRVIDELLPPMLAIAKEQAVDAALFVPA